MGGLICFITTIYCAAKNKASKKSRHQNSGLYPELALFGICKGISAGLITLVSRLAALLPSFELTRRELARQGVDLDIKVVHRIALQTGQQILETRTRDLLAWRKGLVLPGNQLAGKRVGVAIDGGRIRLRENRRRQKGKGKTKTRRRRYTPQWREPKLFIIFELDEHGRMKPDTQPWIEGTFQGPNELMELLAFYLHRLGAAQAEHVVFACDGAEWIWNRLSWVEQKVGLKAEATTHVLDLCHALHHVSSALDALGLTGDSRKRVFRRLRRHLRAARVDLVLAELRRRAKSFEDDHCVWTEINYLAKHDSHMNYRQLRRAGLPMGSGAIESAIRRVVNQRLKGNGIIWLKENAEAMLVLRAVVLTDRWDETFARVRSAMARDRRINWQWSSPDMLTELKSDDASAKNAA
jgi:hypothetical protein